MKVKFLKDYKVQDEKGREFKKGEVHDLSEDSARHFISRGRAKPYDPEDDKPDAKAVELKSLKKDDLIALAEQSGIELDGSEKKEDLVGLLEEARAKEKE